MDNVINKKNFLNRKTNRKMKRKEIKDKKNFFYHKLYDKNYSKNNIKFFSKFNNSNERKLKKIDENKDLNDQHDNENIEDQDVDDEVDSEILSDSGNDNESEENDSILKPKSDLKNINYNNDIDTEINRLERKLGLKDNKRKERFKKQITLENYDDDLFDFLDKIETVVREKPAEFKEDNEKLKSKLKKEKEKKKEIIKENVDEIKSQSRLFSNIKMTEEEKIKLSFQKEITSILNKISEANLILSYPDFIQKIDNYIATYSAKSTENLNDIKLSIYKTISNVSIKQTIEQEITNLPITSCICSYLSILHYKFGNSFMLHFLKTAFDKVNHILHKVDGEVEINSTSNRAMLKNFIFLMIHFYIFENVSSKLYYDLIKHFIENFNELFSEVLLILLSYIGIEIRKEDPESIKDIISNVHKKYNLMKLNTGDTTSHTNSKLKYVVDMIDDIKNNKYLKFNLQEKFNFFKTFVSGKINTIHVQDINSKKICDKIEISYEGIKSVNLSYIDDEINVIPGDSTITNNNQLIDPYIDSFADTELLSKQMRKYKMTTQLKKMIFTAIVSASDSNDAFERLTRLNLKNEQSREIIKVVVLLAVEEKSYNPYYKLLLSRMMSVDKNHKYTFHYTIWDNMRIMDSESYSLKKIHNLAKLVADLLIEEKVSLPVILNFLFEEADEKQKTFVCILFDKYFGNSNSTIDKTKLLFAKLVKNDDHVEFAKRLFCYLIKEFKKEIDIINKSKEYQQCYVAATKVLKRIL